MEEIAHYIFSYRTDLLTEAERWARHNLLLRQKAAAARSDAMKRRLLELMKIQPEVTALLVDGEEVFYRKTVERILREQGEGILNRCPRCSALARTPKAKQCPKCFHDWH